MTEPSWERLSQEQLRKIISNYLDEVLRYYQEHERAVLNVDKYVHPAIVIHVSKGQRYRRQVLLLMVSRMGLDLRTASRLCPRWR